MLLCKAAVSAAMPEVGELPIDIGSPAGYTENRRELRGIGRPQRSRDQSHVAGSLCSTIAEYCEREGGRGALTAMMLQGEPRMFLTRDYSRDTLNAELRENPI